MRDEISAAVLFLVRLIERSDKCNQAQLEGFKTHLSDLLMQRFENHWFPEKPCKGQGYRCIRVNECSRRDAILERAAIACGMKYEDLKLPVELTIWVDPKEVCCRFGEHKGSYCTLASFPGQDSEVKLVVENCPPEVKLETTAATEKSPVTAKTPQVSAPSSPTLPASSPQSPVSTTVLSSVKDTKTRGTSTASSSTSSGTNVNQRTSNSSASNSNPSQGSNNHNNRPRNQNSPKQGSKSGGRKMWPPGPAYQHPLQSWYNMIPPHPWMPASPPPYMIRSPPRSAHPNRYHWSPHKPALKV
ncbi:Maternal B9.15 protein [Frankliniella fusca]|uniref:Maternal B9.15 protein n=1 Tax=Frankliniella fusca TaxID=407009 RepID=A0AAE1HDX3_9NEOP|nr:Maternal B9.15 protein [Frankliniella fusca]